MPTDDNSVRTRGHALRILNSLLPSARPSEAGDALIAAHPTAAGARISYCLADGEWEILPPEDRDFQPVEDVWTGTGLVDFLSLALDCSHDEVHMQMRATGRSNDPSSQSNLKGGRDDEDDAVDQPDEDVREADRRDPIPDAKHCKTEGDHVDDGDEDAGEDDEDGPEHPSVETGHRVDRDDRAPTTRKGGDHIASVDDLKDHHYAIMPAKYWALSIRCGFNAARVMSHLLVVASVKGAFVPSKKMLTPVVEVAHSDFKSWGLTSSAVSRAIKDLVAAKLIKYTSGRGRASSKYTLLIKEHFTPRTGTRRG